MNKKIVTQQEIDCAKSVSIISVISTCGTPKRVGKYYAVKCPFHGDHTPSLYIYPWTNSWWCHSCGIGSDTINFIMRAGQCSFVEAVEFINNKFKGRVINPGPQKNQTMITTKDIQNSKVSIIIINSQKFKDLKGLAGVDFGDMTWKGFRVRISTAGNLFVSPPVIKTSNGGYIPVITLQPSLFLELSKRIIQEYQGIVATP